MSNYSVQRPESDGQRTTEVPGVRRGVKGLVTSSSGVLVVRERHDDGGTFWTLPGGGARRGEGDGAALRRELAEELRSDAVMGGVVGEFAYAHRSDEAPVTVYRVYECSLLSAAEPVRCEGLLEVRWVDPERPPPRTLLAVRHLLAALQCPGAVSHAGP